MSEREVKEKSPKEVCFLGIKEEKMCTFCTHNNTDGILMNTTTTRNMTVNKRKLEHFDDVYAREIFFLAV